ncbi:hypothetical protein Hanom_Chr01g00089321 [Helianthus anomalus]
MDSNGGAGVVPAPAAIVALFAPTVVSLLVCCAFILPVEHVIIAYSLEPFVGILHATKFVLAESFHGCFQLGYTVIFGSYASFFFVRTGS